ncbi:MAG: endoglucanase [Elusimicrobia bacterium]|nr:endoglucanase [Elusimicrobiota bacterium]
MSRLWGLRAVAAVSLAAMAGCAVVCQRELPWPRRRTVSETTHLSCLTGVFRQGDRLLEGRFAIRGVFCAWEEPFPAAALARIRDADSLPLVTWEPYLARSPRRDLLPDIAAGREDERLRRFAAAAAAYRGPVLLRFAHEMNGDWYPWSGHPKLFVEAYRRVHEAFAAAGAPNVRFVFGINAEDVPAGRHNRFEAYDPGPAFVDMVGIDVYNWGDFKPWSRWRGPRRLMEPAYERAVAAFPDKPILLSEVGSCPSGGDKARWMRELFAELPGRFPAVKAFVWFDVDKECDWSFSRHPGLRAAFEAGTSAPHFASDPGPLGWLWGKEVPHG